FTAFSGSHQDAIHKGMKHMATKDDPRYEVPYLPIDPADVGRAYEPVIRINSQSGKSGVAHVLERDHGYRVPRALAIELNQAVQAVTDAGGSELSAQEVGALFERQYFDAPGAYTLESAGVERRREGNECTVVAQLLVRGERGEVRGVGHGPVEAFVAALSTFPGSAFELTDYAEHAATTGANARAVAYVAIRVGDTVRYGAGRDEDVVIAAFRAVVSAYNRAQAAAH
ncbi:MAG TPA: alpha-isopropylmalate synthase regulatory domain-containing protein, partial [Polyangiaceae bacterium]|nr:alpha-isopropylmalate synthase regulatory domain-containing protein [Polyangiaceae bacterium]